MSLQFNCSCGRLLQVAADLANKRVRCPSCSRIVWAPASNETVPDARLVDAPAPIVTGSAPVSAKSSPPVDSPSPSPAAPARTAGRTCALTGHDCGASAGFVISMASLVFGVVTLLLPMSWPVGGLTGALISARSLRRIRSGTGNPASASLARAGLLIGLGQAALGALMLTGLAAMCLRGHNGCGLMKKADIRMRMCTPNVQPANPAKQVQVKQVEVAPVKAKPVSEEK